MDKNFQIVHDISFHSSKDLAKHAQHFRNTHYNFASFIARGELEFPHCTVILPFNVIKTLHSWVETILVGTFGNNFVNFILNITKFGMLINIVEIDKSHDIGCYVNHFGRKLCIP